MKALIFNDQGFKKCSKCKIDKRKEDYYPSPSHTAGYRPECKECTKKKSKQYPKTKLQRKNVQLKHIYGITLEDYNKMFIEQAGVCAICKNPQTVQNIKGITSSLSVDHCHNTGKVRGLLCSACNTALGYFKDSESNLAQAILYLQKSKN